MASRSSLDAIGDCSGALYKLKENGKEWKQIYAVLRGTDLCYYAGEQDAVLDRRLKDGTKAVLGASPGASELVKAPAPVPVPSYFTIETSHAKKVYCAPTEAACAAWVDRIRRCLLYTSPSPRDQRGSRMPSSA